MKKQQLYLSLFITIFLMGLMPSSYGQLLMEDNFDYTADTPILENNWLIQQTNTTNPIMVSSEGLTYDGYIGSGIGNAVKMLDTGQDVFRGFEKQSIGNLFMAFLINVSSASTDGEYFISLKESSTSATNTNYKGRIYVKSDGTSNIAFGASKAGGVIDYTEFSYALNTTYLVVMKYAFADLDFDAANADSYDKVSLYINPKIGGEEPTANIVSTDDKSEYGLGSVLLRQGSAGLGALALIDGLRVGQTWLDAVGEFQGSTMLAYDSFNYSVGELLSAQVDGGWGTLNTAGNTEPVIAEGSLYYPMLEPALGNKVTFDGDGTEVAKTFESQSTDGTTVYFSFVFQVTNMDAITSTDGAHFAGFATGSSTYGCGVYLKWDGVAGSNKFYIGHAARSTSSAVVSYTENTYDINTPLLIVGSYEIVPDVLNDKTQLWVNPASSGFGALNAPAATLNSTTEGGTSSDISPVNKFYIRQDAANKTPFIELDELRIGLSWAEVTPKASVITFNPSNNSTNVDKMVHPSIIYVSPIRKVGGVALGNSDLASLITFKKDNNDGANVTFTATIDDTKQIISVVPSTPLEVSKNYYLAVAAVEDETGMTVSAESATFTVRDAYTDATLSDLKVNGTTIVDFDANTTSYSVVFDYGTTTLPTVEYAVNDQNATATLANISAYPGTAKVDVTAEDGVTKKTYQIAFSVSTTKSSDATLKELLINGNPVPNFQSGVYEYEYVLPFEITTPPTISAVTNSSVATVQYIQPSSLNAMGGVVVTAQDGTEAQYVIFFSVSQYIYSVGFDAKDNTAYPSDGWTTDNTILSNNFGTEPITDHNEFPGIYAFRFICGKAASGSTSGWLATSKYKYSATLRFWLYVQLPDGNEMLTIEKQVADGTPVVVSTLMASDMQANDWKEFSFEINEQDSTAIIFTSSLTEDGDTRIWIDDLSLTGKKEANGILALTENQKNILLYPNPVADQLNFKIDADQVAQITIHNLAGQKLIQLPSSELNGAINVGGLQKGVYIFKVESTEGIFINRFIKN